ncbi:purine-nucleoside phosphorylase [Zhaonella formicivorans]|uniref:purine-nucleoside phosphorylase n=1 Tax=Zhaonella formicivorans TaxID=2528593 RepID=UPI0010D29FB6|nr:purine-nucleoside phosphorylase [Zhaonella formicivorans]
MHNLKHKLEDSIGVINQVRGDLQPRVGLILGSGLGSLAEEITAKKVVPYKDIPHFPVSTVEGHAGQLVFGMLGKAPVMACQGRFHYYEGYTLSEVTYSVRVMQQLGIKILIVTNAAGGINKSFKPGDLMLISDHINLMGDNPLRGKNNPEMGPRFPDMSEAYSQKLGLLAQSAAAELGINLQTGVYAGVFGPSYETPAEIRYLRTIGADAVGMSTVPEVIVANHGGMEVLGISCITNMAAGVLDRKLNHDEVIETAEKVRVKFSGLIKRILDTI